METGTENLKKGKEALEELYQTGEYLFHGSPRILTKLEPRQAYQYNSETGERTPDGEPAVFAAKEYGPAVFKALINSEITPTRYAESGWSGVNGIYQYRAVKELVDGAKKEGVKAYVYVFKKDLFKQLRGGEYISLNEVEPEMIVEITGADLPEKVEFIAAKEQL